MADDDFDIDSFLSEITTPKKKTGLSEKQEKHNEEIAQAVIETENLVAKDAVKKLAQPTTKLSTSIVWTAPDGSVSDLQPDGVETEPGGPNGAPGAVLVPDLAATQGAGLVFGAPLRRITPPKNITPEQFRQVIATAYQQYLVTNSVNVDDVVGRCTVPRAAVELIFGSPQFKAALQTRGVEINPSGLTPEQDYALIILGDPHDGLDFRKKLKKANVTSAKYQAWLRNPFFKAQIDALSEALVSNKHEALVMLSQKVGEGDLNAIRLQLEINQRYNPANESQINMVVTMNKIMEILARNVKDRDTLMSIAKEMRSLADGNMRTPPGLTN